MVLVHHELTKGFFGKIFVLGKTWFLAGLVDVIDAFVQVVGNFFRMNIDLARTHRGFFVDVLDDLEILVVRIKTELRDVPSLVQLRDDDVDVVSARTFVHTCITSPRHNSHRQ